MIQTQVEEVQWLLLRSSCTLFQSKGSNYGIIIRKNDRLYFFLLDFIGLYFKNIMVKLYNNEIEFGIFYTLQYLVFAF